jgi:hypothetical protein
MSDILGPGVKEDDGECRVRRSVRDRWREVDTAKNRPARRSEANERGSGLYGRDKGICACVVSKGTCEGTHIFVTYRGFWNPGTWATTENHGIKSRFGFYLQQLRDGHTNTVLVCMPTFNHPFLHLLGTTPPIL